MVEAVPASTTTAPGPHAAREWVVEARSRECPVCSLLNHAIRIVEGLQGNVRRNFHQLSKASMHEMKAKKASRRGWIGIHMPVPPPSKIVEGPTTISTFAAI